MSTPHRSHPRGVSAGLPRRGCAANVPALPAVAVFVLAFALVAAAPLQRRFAALAQTQAQLTPGTALADSTWLDAPLLQVEELLKLGRYAACDSACLALSLQAQQRDGAESGAAARVLSQWIAVRNRAGRGTEAETLAMAERGLRLRQKVFGSDDVATAVALIDLGGVHYRRGEYTQAVAYTEQALALREKHLPPDHRLVGAAANNLGAFRYLAGDLKGARQPLEQGLAIAERVHGADHPRIAGELRNLSALCSALGDPGAARRYAERAVTILERAAVPDSVQYANALLNLSGTLSEIGDLEQALELNSRALPILIRRQGPEELVVLQERGNRAQLLRRLGHYDQARREIEPALSIAQRVSGPDHPAVAYLHTELAALLTNLGDHDEADAHYAKALAIWEKVGGKQHPQYAAVLMSRAASRIECGRVDEGAAMLRQSVATMEAAGFADRLHGLALSNLAEAQLRLGRPDEAVQTAERAVAAARASSPHEGAQVAVALSTQGRALLEVGETAVARAAHEQALAIRQRELGAFHPETAYSMFQLALTHAKLDQGESALQLALECERVGRLHVRLSARALSEREALLYAQRRPRGADLALSLLARGIAADAHAGIIWSEAAQSRGLVLDEMARRNRAVHRSGDARVHALEQEFASRRRSLAELSVRGAAGEDAPARVEEARSALDRAERALAEASAAFRLQLEAEQSDLAMWVDALPAGYALVAYFRYDDPLAALSLRREQTRRQTEPTAPIVESGSSPEGGEARYVAFVVAGPGAAVAVVSLGDAEQLDASVEAWRTRVMNVAPRRGAAVEDTAASVAGEALRRIAWDPVAGLIQSAATVLIVPDGSLQRVDFAALPSGPGEYLVEHGPTLHFLSAERDLLMDAGRVEIADDGATGSGGLLALGDPDFDAAPLVDAARPAGAEPSRVAGVARDAATGAVDAAAFRGHRPGCGEFEAVRWKRLPQTARELHEVGLLWSSGRPNDLKHATPAVRLVAGRHAHEAALKQLAPGRRALHLATHGFALDGRCGRSGAGERGMGGYAVGRPSSAAGASDAHGASGAASAPGETASDPGQASAATSAAAGENPLQLCGLVLAGANRRSQAGADVEDGIVTAEEIAALDLSSVQWAVLSACETGLGTSRAGEGVFGMRRAFRMAGARTVITSLWQVQDKAAREWMRALYEARWTRGVTTAEAVREASRAQLAACRARGQSTHPRFWAGFIAAGDWR